MSRKAGFARIVALVVLLPGASGLCQDQSEHALVRRSVFSNPLIWRMTKSVTNSYWGIDLFGYPRAGAMSYVMDPWGELYSGVSFKLDKDWCRIVYAEAEGNWIRTYSSYGSAQCQLWAPRSIASLSPFNDEHYNQYHFVYVADSENDRIVRLQYDWYNQVWLCNTPITGGGLDRPLDLDLNDGGTFFPNTDDYLWVINGTGQIKRLTTAGELRSTIGDYGCDSLMWHFCRPTAIASGRSIWMPEPYDEHANTHVFYVADPGNKRIVCLQRLQDVETVAWIAERPINSSIVDLEVDIFGHVWAVDRDAGTMTKYRFDLYPLCTFGSTGIGENQFMEPISMTNNGGYYGYGNMSVLEAWTDTSGGQYFAIGTDVLDFEVSSTEGEHFHYVDFVLIDPSDVSINVYNQQGGLVKTVLDGNVFSGPCHFAWDGTNDSGQQAATGNYRIALVDTSGYWNVHTGLPVNVVTKEEWCHHTALVACCNVRGDVNHDGSGPDITDLLCLTQYMFGGGPKPICDEPYLPDCPDQYFAECDIDGNGTCGPDISDVIALTSYMFGGCQACLVPCP